MIYYSVWKASSISRFLNVLSVPITTSAHLVSSHPVITQRGYSQSRGIKVNRISWERASATGARVCLFVLRFVILKSISQRQQLYKTSGKPHRLKALLEQRGNAPPSPVRSVSSTGFAGLLDNTQRESVPGSSAIKNFILSKRSRQGRNDCCHQKGELAAAYKPCSGCTAGSPRGAPAAPPAPRYSAGWARNELREHSSGTELWLRASIPPPATLFERCTSAISREAAQTISRRRLHGMTRLGSALVPAKLEVPAQQDKPFPKAAPLASPRPSRSPPGSRGNTKPSCFCLSQELILAANRLRTRKERCQTPPQSSSTTLTRKSPEPATDAPRE